jgi:hypothetical protein
MSSIFEVEFDGDLWKAMQSWLEKWECCTEPPAACDDTREILRMCEAVVQKANKTRIIVPSARSTQGEGSRMCHPSITNI